MNKYGKKWGVKVYDIELPNVEEAGRHMWAVDITPEMKESVMQGQVMFSKEEEYKKEVAQQIDKRIAELHGLEQSSISSIGNESRFEPRSEEHNPAGAGVERVVPSAKLRKKNSQQAYCFKKYSRFYC